MKHHRQMTMMLIQKALLNEFLFLFFVFVVYKKNSNVSVPLSPLNNMHPMHPLLILIIFTARYIKGETITCDNGNSGGPLCDETVQICNRTLSNPFESCSLNCNGARSCSHTTFICLSAISCSVTCDNDGANGSCKNAKIIAISPIISIKCDGLEACQDMEIIADLTELEQGLNIICGTETDHDRSCAFMNVTINGLPQVETLIQCGISEGLTPTHAPCLNMTVYCNVGECHTECADENLLSCFGNTIYCEQYGNCEGITWERNKWNVVSPAPTILPTAPPRYIFVDPPDGGSTWQEAEQLCVDNYNSHLATIITEEDFQEAVYESAFSEAWIGLNNLNQNGWNWIDGANWYVLF